MAPRYISGRVAVARPLPPDTVGSPRGGRPGGRLCGWTAWKPTTTVAERMPRLSVRWRTGSVGSDSAAGRRLVERVLTVGASCPQHGRRLLDVLVAAGEAAVRGLPPPALLPAPLGGLNEYHDVR